VKIPVVICPQLRFDHVDMPNVVDILQDYHIEDYDDDDYYYSDVFIRKSKTNTIV
jgi:hypothetical protein